MDINILRSIATVVSFVLFLGVVWWAYRRSNAERFHEASMLPFALDDETVEESDPPKKGQV